MRDDRGDDLGLAAALADGVVVLDPAGRIAWVNDAFARLVGHDPADLHGRTGLDLIHPDELARAIDGIAYATQFPGQTSVAPYRVRAGDGSWLDIELKSGVVTRDDGDHLILLIRDGTAHRATNRALQSVANGAALEHTAAILLEALTWRWRGTGAAIVIREPDGHAVAIESGLTAALREHALDRCPSGPEWGPAALAAEGAVAVWDRTELPPALAEAAAQAGFEGCAVARVPDPAGHDAHVVVWFEHTVIGRLEFTHLAREILELLSLALERRHHLRQLEELARHDPLTGVLNRAGLLGELGRLVQRAAEEARAVAVLYIDLDGLKAANDGGGHAAGDQLLVEVAGRLRRLATEGGLVGRLGGDEFVLVELLPPGAGGDHAACVASAVAEALSLVVCTAPSADGTAAGTQVEVSASVGLAVHRPGELLADLLDRADAAMYRAKGAPGRAGRSRWSE